MPDLAILLGTSPCDERVTPNDPDTKLCAPMLAHHCFGYSESMHIASEDVDM
ncbi:hypothetical protein D6D18_06930, partial [Aureobasidium pullulans]